MNAFSIFAFSVRRATAALLLVLALGFVSSAAAHETHDHAGQTALIPNVFADIAERALPSVVAVYVKVDIRESIEEMHEELGPLKKFFEDPQWKEYFEDPEGRRDPDDFHNAQTSGSGVIISEDGYIVTNNHIIGDADASKLTVLLHDDTEIASDKINVVAVDELLDLAVLKIDPDGLDLKPMAWGDSSALRIGDWVLAIGNPLDLRGSVSKGIVSAKGRRIGKAGIEHLIQTDAMINPGNSGGALVNLRGELIGINMAIATSSGYFQGIGFAIPSNDARDVVEQILEYGRVRHGYIGIYMQPLEDLVLRRALGLENTDVGIAVADVVEGAPAEQAGIRPYDVITAIDGEAVRNTQDVLSSIAVKSVGETAQVAVQRLNKRGKAESLDLTMQVTERPPAEEILKQSQALPSRDAGMEQSESDAVDLGLTLKPYDEGGVQGLRVEEVETPSPASRAGLSAGDIILEADRRAVVSRKDFRRIYEDWPAGQPLLLRYLRGNRQLIGAIVPETEEE